MLDRRGAIIGQDVATIPVAGSGPSARASVIDALSRLGDARAVILDLTQAQAQAADPLSAPSLDALCARIEATRLPVVAACRGELTGDRFAIALAAHYRIAQDGTHLRHADHALPIVPAGGLAVRLMCLGGAPIAERLLFEGATLTSAEALAARLFDKTVAGAPVEAAAVFARILLERGLGPRPSIDEDRGLAGGWLRMRPISDRKAEAPELVEALEAALLLPGRAALDLSETLAAETRRRDGTQAALHLRHAGARFGTATPLSHLACLGLDGAAADLATAHLRAGGRVTLIAPSDAEGAAMRARFPEDQEERITVTLDPAALQDAEAALVCLPMPLEQQAILARSGRIATPTALVTPLPVGAAREVLRLFTAPVLIQARSGCGLIEASLGEASETGPLAALAERAGVRIIPRDAGLPVGDRLLARLRWAAQVLLEEGATVSGIDHAMREAGYSAPVFETLDAEGLDAPRTLLLEQMGPARDARGAALPAILRSAGRTGAEAGQGYYMHGPEGAEDDPALDHVLAQIRDKRQLTPQDLNDADCLAGLHAALVNAALELVAEGQPADTVDLAAVEVAGFHAASGGPLMAADRLGLIALRRQTGPLARAAPQVFAPHPLWVEAIKYGRRFCPVY